MVLLSVRSAWGQEDGRITGRVTDGRSGEPLQDITVVLVGTLVATLTDVNGTFVFASVPAGGYTIAASALGYEDHRLEVMVLPGEEKDVHIQLDALEVQGDRKHADVEVARARRGATDGVPVVRGLWDHQVAVYVDGVRFMPTSLYGFGFPVSVTDSIEVMRGARALAWGALHVLRVTRRRASSPGLRYAFQLRSYDLGATGQLDASAGNILYQLHGDYRAGRDYRDGAGHRVQANYRGGLLRGRVAYGGFVMQGGYHKREGLDTIEGLFTGGEWEAADLASQYHKTWNGGLLRALDARVSWQRQLHVLSRAHSSEASKVTARLATRLSSGVFVLDVGADMYSILHSATRVFTNVRTTNMGLFALAVRATEQMELSAAARFDRAYSGEDYRRGSLSGALAFHMRLSSRWQLLADLGTVTRAATAYELFAPRAPYARSPHLLQVGGNPTLRPERHTQAEVGLQASYPGWEATIQGFVIRLGGFISPALSVMTYENSTATLWGLQAQARVNLIGKYAVLQWSASHVRGYDHNQRQSMYGIMPMSATAGVVLTLPARLARLGVTLRGAARQSHVAEYHGEQSTGGYAVLDLRLHLALLRNFSLTLGMDNVTDARYAYHLSARGPNGMPAAEPGRAVYVRIGRGF